MARSSQVREYSVDAAQRLVLKAWQATRRGKPAPKVPMLWGPPGIGKSEMIQNIAESGALGEKVDVIDIRLPLMEPTDIRGIPYFDAEAIVMRWAASEELPTEEHAAQFDTVILFLDELSAAPQSVQAASYQLMLNRRVGPYVLPKNVLVVAAGNGEGDGSVSFKMPQALRNRMIHFQIKADFESWFNWAVKNHIHPDILGFISYQKSTLFNFDSKSPDKAWPSPRTWTFTSDVMEMDLAETDLMDLSAGLVGEAAALSFQAYRKIGKDLPKPADILSGKVKDLKNKEASAMYSLTFNLCQELRLESDKVETKKMHQYANNAMVYMMANFTKDMTIMGIRTMLFTYSLDIDPTMLDCFDELHAKYGKSVQKAMKSAN